MGHKCIVRVVLESLKGMECHNVYIESTVMNTNWQKELKKGRRVFMKKVSELHKIGWSEQITPVLSIDVELVVMAQRHNSCLNKPIRVMR